MAGWVDWELGRWVAVPDTVRSRAAWSVDSMDGVSAGDIKVNTCCTVGVCRRSCVQSVLEGRNRCCERTNACMPGCGVDGGFMFEFKIPSVQAFMIKRGREEKGKSR